MGYIYGCVDWSDSGTIKFDNSAFVCTGTTKLDACIEWTGAHAGMVKLVVTDAAVEDCKDTYYGCIDWSNDGKFEILIPDDCCTGYCQYCCTGVPYCEYTPEDITVTFSGLQADTINCVWDTSYARNFSGTGVTEPDFQVVLSRGSGTPLNECTWEASSPVKTMSTSPYSLYFPPNGVCTSKDADYINQLTTLKVIKDSATAFRVLGSGTVSVAVAAGTITGGCIEVNAMSNDVASAPIPYFYYGGTITIEQGDTT